MWAPSLCQPRRADAAPGNSSCLYFLCSRRGESTPSPPCKLRANPSCCCKVPAHPCCRERARGYPAPPVLANQVLHYPRFLLALLVTCSTNSLSWSLTQLPKGCPLSQPFPLSPQNYPCIECSSLPDENTTYFKRGTAG